MDHARAGRTRFARGVLAMFGIGSSSLGDLTKITSLPEFDDHVLVSYAGDEETGLRSIIAVHRSNPEVPSFGATRLWHYATSLDGVKDALRLSRGMSYKAALAGLACGGAKGVILAKHTPKELDHEFERERTRLVEAYAKRINILGGRFVTGTDVGIRQEDLDTMRKQSRNIIGFNNNSTEFTAISVFEAIKAALQEKFGSPDPEGHNFAIQGLGKVGGGLLTLLYESAGASGKIFISDIDALKIEEMKKKYPRVIPVSPEAIDEQEAEVFCPCALSGVINKESVKRLKAKIVAGGGNNQLADEDSGDLLHARAILYVPDYVANAGGLIAVFDEYKNHSYDRARVEKAVLHIPETLRKIFAESRSSNTPPNRVANAMAEKLFNGYGNASAH
jgi:leucine dehydrogenase